MPLNNQVRAKKLGTIAAYNVNTRPQIEGRSTNEIMSDIHKLTGIKKTMGTTMQSNRGGRRGKNKKP